MDDLYWGAIGIYVAGIITGAVLVGWSPGFLVRWESRREERRQQRTSDRMKKLVVDQAEKLRRKKERDVG